MDDVLKEYRELVADACRRCGVPALAGKNRLAWNVRFTARMGDAHWDAAYGCGVIRLSAPLWPRATPAERRETVIHEACHVIADYHFGRRQHHGPGGRTTGRRSGCTSATSSPS